MLFRLLLAAVVGRALALPPRSSYSSFPASNYPSFMEEIYFDEPAAGRDGNRESRQTPQFSNPGFAIPFKPDFSFNEFGSPFASAQGFQQFISGLGGDGALNTASSFSDVSAGEFRIPNGGGNFKRETNSEELSVNAAPIRPPPQRKSLQREPEASRQLELTPEFKRPQPVYNPESNKRNFQAEPVREKQTGYRQEYQPVYRADFRQPAKQQEQAQPTRKQAEDREEQGDRQRFFQDENLPFPQEGFNIDFQSDRFEIKKEERPVATAYSAFKAPSGKPAPDQKYQAFKAQQQQQQTAAAAGFGGASKTVTRQQAIQLPVNQYEENDDDRGFYSPDVEEFFAPERNIAQPAAVYADRRPQPAAPIQSSNFGSSALDEPRFGPFSERESEPTVHPNVADSLEEMLAKKNKAANPEQPGFTPPKLIERFSSPVVEPSIAYNEPQRTEVATESEGLRRVDRKDNMPGFGGPEPENRKHEHAASEPESLPSAEQQIRQLRSEPEPVKAPSTPPPHKYEPANFREPVKTPQVSQEPNPIIRIKMPSKADQQPQVAQARSSGPEYHYRQNTPGRMEVVEVRRPVEVRQPQQQPPQKRQQPPQQEQQFSQLVFDDDQEIITLSPEVKRFSGEGGKQSFAVDVKASFSPHLDSHQDSSKLVIQKRHGPAPSAVQHSHGPALSHVQKRQGPAPPQVQRRQGYGAAASAKFVAGRPESAPQRRALAAPSQSSQREKRPL